MQKIGEIKAELQALQPEEYDAFFEKYRQFLPLRQNSRFLPCVRKRLFSGILSKKVLQF